MSMGCSWCATRWRPGSAVRARCSPASKPELPQTFSCWARGSAQATSASRPRWPRARIFRAFLGGEDAAFMHGPTFMGNALACAVALASLRIFQRDGYLGKIRRMEQIMREELLGIVAPSVCEVRVLGACAVIEVEPSRGAPGDPGFCRRTRGVAPAAGPCRLRHASLRDGRSQPAHHLPGHAQMVRELQPRLGWRRPASALNFEVAANEAL